MHLPWQRKLHNKIKPPYVRLSSSWHKGRFKHVCLHFQNNLNCLQVCIGGKAKNILSIYRHSFYTFLHHDLWLWSAVSVWFVGRDESRTSGLGEGGDKKTKSNPLWMVVDYLDLVTGSSSKLSLDRAPSSGPSVVLWHFCQFLSTQPNFTNTQI